MRLTLFVVLVICSSAASAVREEPEEGPGPTAAGALQSGHPHDVNAIFPCDGKPCPVNAFDPWHENPRKANPNAKGPDGQPLGAGGSAGAAALAEQKAADAAKAAADKAAIKDAAAAAAETAKAEEEEKALGADASKAMAAAAEAGKKEGDAAAKKAEAAAEKAGKDAAKGGAGKGGSSGSGSGSGSGKSGSGKSGSGSSGSKGSGSSGSKGGSGSKGSGSKGSGSKASGKGGKGKKDGKGKNGGKGGAGGCPGQTNVCSRKRRRCLNKCKKDERAKKAEKQEKKVEKKLEASLQKNVQKSACPCAQQAPAAQPAGCPCQAAAAAAAAAGTPAPTEAPAAKPKPTPKPTEASGPEYGKPTDDQRKTAAPPCPEGAFCKGARTQMQQVIVDNGGPDLAKDNRFQQEPDIADMQQETGGASLTMSQAEAEELDDNNEDSYDMGPADEEDEAAAPIDPAVDQEQTKELEQAVDDAVPADDDTDAQNEDDIADAEQEGDEDLADATDEDDMLLQFQLRLMGTFTKGAADSIEKCTTKCESRFSTCQKVQKLQKAKADAQAKCGK